jgi:hypothetical protein
MRKRTGHGIPSGRGVFIILWVSKKIYNRELQESAGAGRTAEKEKRVGRFFQVNFVDFSNLSYSENEKNRFMTKICYFAQCG